MPHPFEITEEQLGPNLDAMVDATFADIESQFLILPKGNGYVPYGDFQSAYEVLKRHTGAFKALNEITVWTAIEEDGLSFVVLRTILGLSPPEWADLARSDLNSDVNQGVARNLDTKPRHDRAYFAKLKKRSDSVTYKRAADLVKVAIEYISRGAPSGAADTVHRLAKVDTTEGLSSLRHVAASHVPYSVLLYERYLGRPFASHRDSVSELVGDVMESAVEERLANAGITFRKTRRAERIEGFEQAPDFFAPTEFSPTVIIEAKITSDDGTARDKVSRILRLASMRDERARAGRPSFEVVACIDGRGFSVRRQDMKDMLHATKGKVFTLNSLDRLIPFTELKKLLPKAT